MKNFNIFPLNSLVKQAKKFNSYEEFYTFYIVDIFHGYYWHITKDANFKISSQTGPRDMSSMSSGGITEKGAIMLTSHFELWDDYYNSHPETEERIIKRPFAVLFDASDVDPKRLRQISRGFGNEVYLNREDAKKLKQIAIYPIDKAKTIDEKLHKIIPNSDKELRNLYNFAHSINENINLRIFIRSILKESLDPEHAAYLKWKRKNVSFRGMKNVGEENGSSAMLGRGLYSASLSNKSMTKRYGQPYFAVNAVPKHPKVFNTLNEWEIWFQNMLVYKFSKEKGKNYPDARDFFEKTTIEDEMQKLNYDGIIIIGREMVNYTPPDNVKYFRAEDEVKQYYLNNVLGQGLTENIEIDEGIFNFHPKAEKLKTFIQGLKSKYQASLYIYPEKTEDDDIYSIMLGKIKIPASKRGMGYGSKIMNDLIDFSNQNNVKIYLTPSDIFGSSIDRLKQFYGRFGFTSTNDGDKMVYAPHNQSSLNENLKIQIDKIIKRILNHYTLSDSDFLGGGTFGRAYKYGPHLVLKITSDREEAIFADMIKGKKFERISNVYSVQKIKGTNFFVIILDRLEEITDNDISQALFRISTDDNIYDINGISQEKIQWAQNEYDALINELENAPLHDGYRDVHVGNMGLKKGKLAVYDIQVSDYKRWREKKIRSVKIDENSEFNADYIKKRTEVENFRNSISRELNITLELYYVNSEYGPALKLPLIKVPDKQQRQGLGSQAMRKIIQYADDNNLRIFLSPSTDWGSSKTGLDRFYKRFGFVAHSGRNRDYHFKDDMVRLPNKNINELDEEIDAFHGTPHEFDKFDIDKIGSGEGTQAFGWGLYFSDVIDVAKNYAERLTDKDVKIGEELASELRDKTKNPVWNWIITYMTDDGYNKMNISQVIEKLQEQLNDTEWLKNNSWVEKNIKAVLQYIANKDVKPVYGSQYVYKVKINKGKMYHNWLNWSEPIPENQIQLIVNQFKEENYNGRIHFTNGKLYKKIGSYDEIIRGKDFYYALAGDKGFTDELASKFLWRAGFDGIKYPTDSTGAGGGNITKHGYNYVIFDDSIVSIEKIEKNEPILK